MAYLHDEWCSRNLDGTGCDCYVRMLEARDERVKELEAELDGMEQAWDDVMERERVALEQITILKAKLEAIECGECEKSMLRCTCDEESE